METEFCPQCNKEVEVEGKLDVTGLQNTCISCGTETLNTGKFAVWYLAPLGWRRAVGGPYTTMDAAKTKRDEIADLGYQAVITVW